jgi:hypothetical protein
MKVGVLATMVLTLTIGFPIASFAGLAPDDDGDGIPNVLDKCTLDSRNATAPATCDTDTDGYGNVCDGDYDQNFTTNSTDFTTYFVPKFKNAPALGGAVPGPSGLPCAGTPGCM